MGTADRSEHTERLRAQVLDALGQARERHHGRLSRFIVKAAAQAARTGLTKDDFYRAAQPEKIGQLSASKLARLLALLAKTGFTPAGVEPGAALRGAVLALSRTSHPPDTFRDTLPRAWFCLRRSYLAPRQVNVSYVEMAADETAIRYRETRAGSSGANSQRAVVEGALSMPDADEEIYYVVGLTEFRTSLAVEATTSVRANQVSLSVLRPCRAGSSAALHGIHAGVLPDNNPDFPLTPYAARLLLIETTLTLAQAAQRGLVQNHPAADVPRLKGWGAGERALLKLHYGPCLQRNTLDPRYGLLISGGAGDERAVIGGMRRPVRS